MSTSISPIAMVIAQFKLQTRLFKNVTEGISDKNSIKKAGDLANHVAWITGHIVSTRYMLGMMIGLQEMEPFSELFERGKGISPEAEYPSMKELTKNWAAISENLEQKLYELPAEVLNAPAPFPLAIEDSTMKGVITFFAHHEAYHIGQIGLYRKIIGLDAMKYS